MQPWKQLEKHVKYRTWPNRFKVEAKDALIAAGWSLLIVCGVIGLSIGIAALMPDIIVPLPAPTDNHVITKIELQIQLKELGYYTDKIDGVVGPNMLDAWEACINDQSAAIHF
jgi:hypothetical protein